jgi:CheY-like chemotaxis protein
MQERLATVGQLAAGIAHDFNNIMAAIVVYADLLRMDTTISSSSQERLAIIQQQVQRAASLIRQILDFSRRSVMEQSSLDLLPFIKEIEKLLNRTLPETITVELHSREDEYILSADPTRLQQVFMNLAVNARDAMPEGGTLSFDLSLVQLKEGDHAPSADMPPGNWVHIRVSDTGTGIPPEDQSHIFEPFFTTKPVGQGTGLGLAQVYGIVKQHDGYIDVTSQVGEGTQFNIFLPTFTTPKKEAPVDETAMEIDGDGKMVLLVEDDAATRKALQTMLSMHNYRVLVAENGIEALEYLEKDGDEIVMVVSDVVMPQMGGFGLYEKMQIHWPHIEVLFITGHPLDDQNQSILQQGKVHWLQKPFTVQEFNQTLFELLA